MPPQEISAKILGKLKQAAEDSLSQFLKQLLQFLRILVVKDRQLRMLVVSQA